MNNYKGCEFCGDCIYTSYKQGYGFICNECLDEEIEEEYRKKNFTGPPKPWYWGYNEKELKTYFKPDFIGFTKASDLGINV